MPDILTTELTFGPFNYGTATETNTGIKRKLIWIVDSSGIVINNPFADPVLTQTSPAGTNPPTWSFVMPDLQVGDRIQLDFTSNGSAPDGVAEETHDPVTSDEAINGDITWTTFTGFSAAATVKWRQRYGRDIAGVPVWSNWSNTLSDVMATGTIVLPSTITGIKDYYKVSTARLWKDTAGTIAVTADGDLVARWDSEMGTMAPFLQTTSGNRPIYRANSGNPYLEFDGAASFMSCGATAIGALAQPFYIIAAAKLTALLGSQAIYDGATNTTNRANVFQNNIGSPNYQWEISAGTFVGTQGLIPTTNDVVIGGLFNGASSQGRIDQTNGSVISIGVQSPIDGLRLGSAPDGSGWLGGRIYGFVLVAASPSAGDKTNISTYLGSLQGRTI